MKNALKILAVAALVLAVTGCDKKKNLDPVTRSYDGKHYENKRFELAVEKPEGWYAQDAEANSKLTKEGSKMLFSNDKDLQNKVDAASEKTKSLFGFFSVPPGTPGVHNPNVLGLAEKLPMLANIKTGCDYLEKAKDLLGKSQMNADISFDGACQKTTINGQTFGSYGVTIRVGSVKVQQRHYACVQDDYAIAIVQTYFGDKTEAETKPIIDSLKVHCTG